MKKYGYMIKTVNKNMEGYNGFKYPKRGKVVALDWNPKPVCGGGIHGLIHETEKHYIEKNDIWLVLKYKKGTEVVIDNEKIKVPYAWVVFAGTAEEAQRKFERLTRKKLEEMTEDLIDRTIGPCQQALNDAGLEIRDIDTVILVGGQTRMPLVQEKVKNFFGKEPSQCVNPDEIVAVGAAIQGSVLKNEIRNVTIADITALSLGIETEGGQYTKIIEKNTKIPWVSEKEFTTVVNNQEVVEISVYQGEALEVKDNIKLGNFLLEGITLAPAGVPRINVEYCLDENGILTVSARDVDTGVEKKVTISNRVV